jgi:L-fuculose-phosphate aldolase
MTLYASADDVATLYRDLGERGLNVGSSGNVSARRGMGMVITPTGIRGDDVRPDMLVHMTLDGEVEGGFAPSSEWEMHAAIYRECADAMVIVHTHSDYATALACLALPLPAFHYAVAEFGGDDVRCAPYVTFGTPELARLAAEGIEGRTACLLGNHGMICRGRDAPGALTTALRLETLCRQYLIARTAGTPRLLTRAEMAAAQERYRTYGQRTPYRDSADDGF